MQLDLSDWKATTQIASKVADSVEQIDALVLNAARGIMTAQRDAHDVDLHMSINHIGHVVLTSHLLPLLKKSAKNGTVRIAIQSSNAHQCVESVCSLSGLDPVQGGAELDQVRDHRGDQQGRGCAASLADFVQG
jgi:NAD(P)-dependent dehydrogenase (short-subunit alcohol dehydrogenase family)